MKSAMVIAFTVFLLHMLSLGSASNSDSDERYVFNGTLHENGTLSITCTTNGLDPSSVENIAINAHVPNAGYIAIAEIERKNGTAVSKIPELGQRYSYNRYTGSSNVNRNPPARVFGQINTLQSSSTSLVTPFLTVQLLNISGCHHARYQCQVWLLQQPGGGWAVENQQRQERSLLQKEATVAACAKYPTVLVEDELSANATLTIRCSVSDNTIEPYSVVLGNDMYTDHPIAEFIKEYPFNGRTQNVLRRPADRYSRSGYHDTRGRYISYNEEFQQLKDSGRLFGHLGSKSSYIAFQVNVSSCHRERYWCDVSVVPDATYSVWSKSDTIRLPRVFNDVNVCDGNTGINIVKPDKYYDPAHFILTCNVTGKSSASDVTRNASSPDVTFMQLRYIGRNDSQVAYANVSLDGGRVIATKALVEQGMVISGSIDQSDPSKSWLKIESGLCHHAGTFACDVFFSDGNKTDYSVAVETVPNVCEQSQNTVSLPVSSPTASTFYVPTDPTSFEVTCKLTELKDAKLISMQLSLFENYIEVGRYVKRDIATYSSINGGMLIPSAGQGSFQVHSKLESEHESAPCEDDDDDYDEYYSRTIVYKRVLRASTQAGSCTDTGRYRCTVLFWGDSETGQRGDLLVAVADTVKAPCGVGAVAKHLEHRRFEHQDHYFSFTCSANASLASKVVSLEIRRRTEALAVAVASLNDGRASKLGEGHFKVKGIVKVDEVEASYLKVITKVKPKDYRKLVREITTCRVVYEAHTEKGVMREALAEGTLEYPPATEEN